MATQAATKKKGTDKVNVEVKVALPQCFEEKGVPIDVEIDIHNDSKKIVVLTHLNELMFSADELFTPGSGVSQEWLDGMLWTNALAPGATKKIVLPNQTFTSGRHEIVAVLGYQVPSLEYASKHIYESVAEDQKPLTKFPAKDTGHTNKGNQPVLLAEKPGLDKGRDLRRVRVVHSFEVTADPVITNLRKQMEIKAFRKGIPYFDYLIFSGQDMYLWLDKQAQPIGWVSFGALCSIGQQLADDPKCQIKLLSTHNEGKLGELFGDKVIEKSDAQPKKAKQATYEGASYYLNITREDLPKLWESLIADGAKLTTAKNDAVPIIVDRDLHSGKK